MSYLLKLWYKSWNPLDNYIQQAVQTKSGLFFLSIQWIEYYFQLYSLCSEVKKGKSPEEDRKKCIF